MGGGGGKAGGKPGGKGHKASKGATKTMTKTSTGTTKTGGTTGATAAASEQIHIKKFIVSSSIILSHIQMTRISFWLQNKNVMALTVERIDQLYTKVDQVYKCAPMNRSEEIQNEDKAPNQIRE